MGCENPGVACCLGAVGLVCMGSHSHAWRLGPAAVAPAVSLGETLQGLLVCVYAWICPHCCCGGVCPWVCCNQRRFLERLAAIGLNCDMGESVRRGPCS